MPFWKSLYVRIAAVFVLLIALVSALQLVLAAQRFTELAATIEQRRNWDVAVEVRDQIQALVYPDFNADAATRAIVELQRLNPSLRIAILDSGANILAYAPHNLLWVPSRVEPSVLHQALQPINPELPLVAKTWQRRTGPELGRTGEELFSVAPLELAAGRGFVYVALDFFDSRPLGRIGQFALTRGALQGFFITICGALVLGALAFIVMTKRFREAIRVLRLIAKDDFSQRVSSGTQDEVGEIAAAINSMADAVLESRIRLEHRDAERRQLIAGITHDLRNPLTATMLKLEDLQSRFIGSEVSIERGDFEILRRNAKLQKRLVEDLFELSKLEAVQKVSLDQIALARVTGEVIERMRPVAYAAAVELAFSNQADSSTDILADRVLIERALGNILENAVRYSPANSTVCVTLRFAGESVELCITDAGSGVDAAVAENLFESGVNSADSPGAGLGLAIVSKIIALHNGTLACESTAGAGTTFKLTLPLA